MVLSREAAFVIYLVAFVDMVGFSMPNPLIPFYFTHLAGFEESHQGVTYGVLVTTYALGQLFGQLLFGYWSDQVGRRIPITIGIFGTSTFSLISAVAPSTWHLAGARFIQGVFGGTGGVLTAYLIDHGDTELQKTKLLSKLMAVLQSALIVGPALGITAGFLLGTQRIVLAWRIVCVSASALGVCATAGAFFSLAEAPSRTTGTDAERHGLLRELGRIVSDGQMLALNLTLLCTVFTISCFEAALPLLLSREQHAPLYQVIVVFASMALLAVPVNSALLPALTAAGCGLRYVVYLGLSAATCTVIWLPVFMVWYIQATLTGICSLVTMVIPALTILASLRCSDEAQGTTMGFMRSVSAFARMLGPLCGGILYDYKIAGNSRALPFVAAALSGLLALVSASFIVQIVSARKAHVV